MNKPEKFKRFLLAQSEVYPNALGQVRSGKKSSHWMWYIFPQLKGLGKSKIATYYGLADLNQAADYLNHPILGQNLLEITQALLKLRAKSALEIFGAPDDLKLRSCMTLFAQLEKASPVFNQVLDQYFGGHPDPLTLKLLHRD
jgi:uncharacterized protein (DUF1810 family)